MPAAPIRLAAIMEIPVIHIFTHDSIGVGEDGPTHQPIEQLLSLRAIPGLIVIRPATPTKWSKPGGDHALHHEPVVPDSHPARLADVRPHEVRPGGRLAQGAYVMADAADGKPDVILIGTGSEVSLCVQAYEKLKSEGIKARVVSMPSWELFEPASRRLIATRYCPPRSPRGSPSSKPPHSDGHITSARRAR